MLISCISQEIGLVKVFFIWFEGSFVMVLVDGFVVGLFLVLGIIEVLEFCGFDKL